MLNKIAKVALLGVVRGPYAEPQICGASGTRWMVLFKDIRGRVNRRRQPMRIPGNDMRIYGRRGLRLFVPVAMVACT
jgi:hypothetical protein